MGFLQRLFGVEKRSEDTEIGGMISADEVITSLIGGGEQITEDTAMEIPAFSAAVDFVAGTIAMLPIKLCDDNAKEQSTSENADDYRLSLLNDETRDLLGSYGAKYAQVRDMLCGGAGYMYINRNGSQIKSLHYVSRSDISVIKSYDPIFKTADIMVSGKRYNPFDFVILARKSADGVTGTGIVEEHKTILSAMYNALKYESIVSKTGGNKKGFLTSKFKLTKDGLRELSRAWQEVYSNNESRAMVLNEGLNFIPSSATAVEMQMNESKETNSAQIAAMFGLSPQVISGEAPESVYMSAVRTAIMPIVAAYQEALNRALLLESEKPNKYFILDTTELLRGDILTRYNAYAVGLANNFLQIDEVRYKEDLKPLGLNFVKLGLQDVLLNPNDNTVYTPNTNSFVKVGEKPLDNSLESGIMEERARHYTKGAHGYFTGSTSDGGEGGSSGSSGGVSGGLSPNDDKAVEHAERYYESVRHMTTDVKHIAQNTGFSEDEIQEIKNYVFMEKHDLGDGRYAHFDPSFEMAQSWQRLIDGKNIQPHDITLLKHETMERNLVRLGYTQDEAHRITSKSYDYRKESSEYYDKAKKH